MGKYVEASNTIKTDCIQYSSEKVDCKALKCLYCRTENCGFYKSNSQYNADGSLK